MSIDAITLVSEAETDAHRLQLEATADGKRRLAEAQQEGEETIKTALQKAAAELTEYRNEAGKLADEAVRKFCAETEEQKKALRAAAEAKLADAADMIVERIVNR